MERRDVGGIRDWSNFSYLKEMTSYWFVGVTMEGKKLEEGCVAESGVFGPVGNSRLRLVRLISSSVTANRLTSNVSHLDLLPGREQGSNTQGVADIIAFSKSSMQMDLS